MIVFYGDPHGNFDAFHESVQKDRPSAGIMLGDLDLERPFEEEVADFLATGAPLWWIVGNHDTDADHWHDNLFGSKLAEQNISGRVIEVTGIRIAGLGGVFRGAVWDPRMGPPRFHTRDEFIATNKKLIWRDGLPRKHRSTIFPEDIEALSSLRADILVCHEAPSTHKFGFAVIDDVARKIGARTIIHGHHHRPYEDVLPDGIKVVCVEKAGLFRLPGRSQS